MKKITEVTRQDILDIVRDGFEIKFENPVFDSETGQYLSSKPIKMWFAGRVEIIPFLSRLYDLEQLPSTDHRFKNALEDISCHMNWGDYRDDYWFLDDKRFRLSRYDDDEPLLRFLCEILHPVVRREDSPWELYLKKFNELLRPDGYELYPAESISGRDTYRYRETDCMELPHASITTFPAKKALGEGSYAKTFRYTDPFYNKAFAVKTAKPNLGQKELERFKREFDQMKQLRSPHIVEVYNYFPDKNEYTMELMDCTLYDYISKNNATLSLGERKRIILQLLRAYSYLHSRSIYHRDVSPRNTLVNVYDDAIIVKISDFGLVKIPESDLTSESTELKGSMNDPALKVTGFSNYELRHELYAITLLFVFVLTGKCNWAKIKEPPIVEFMNKGTDADIDKRFQTLDELKQGIVQCIEDLNRDSDTLPHFM